MTRLYEPSAGWDSPPAGKCRPGMAALRRHLEAVFDGENLGCYVDRPKTSSTSPSLHRDGRAIDIGFAGRLDVREAAFDWLVENADALELQMVLNYKADGLGGRRWRLPYNKRDTKAGLGTFSSSGHWLHIERTNAGADNPTPIADLLLPPADTFVPVVDVSKWQDAIDFGKLAATGVAGVIARVGNGKSPGPDPRFPEYAAGAAAAGLPLGAYYWIRPFSEDEPAEAQARQAVAEIGDRDVRFFMLDIEWNDLELGPKPTAEWIRRFLAELRRIWQKPIIGYSSAAYWNTHVADAVLAAELEWIVPTYSRKGETPPNDPTAWHAWILEAPKRPKPPAGATDWQGWQFSSELHGPTFGVSSARLDANLIRSDAWERWTCHTPPPTPTPPARPPRLFTVNVNLPHISRTATGVEGHIRMAQALLNTKSGAGLEVDGKFGAKTEQAVRNWQSWHRLTVDGIVGPVSWRSLIENV